MSKNELAILKTLAYSDLFDYPLTRDELWRYLVREKPLSKKAFQGALASMLGDITYTDGFYCLAGRKNNIALRKKRARTSQKKKKLAEKAARFLMVIPGIVFVGISGGVAVDNAEEDDDIDLFIITKSKRLWLTRLLSILLLDRRNLRRKPDEKVAPDKICLNMFIDGGNLTLPKDRQDIYTAHEVVQLYPLFDREGSYQRFLAANDWVSRFLPNAIEQRAAKRYKDPFFSMILRPVFGILTLEQLAKALQLRYMKRRRTREEITDQLLFFHPVDYRNQALSRFAKTKHAKKSLYSTY